MINLRQEVFYRWSRGARGGHFPRAQEGNVEMLRESTIPPIRWVGEYLHEYLNPEIICLGSWRVNVRLSG